MLVKLLQSVRVLQVFRLSELLNFLLFARAQRAVAGEIGQLHRCVILVERDRFGVYASASTAGTIERTRKHVLVLAWVDLSSAVPLSAQA